MKLRIDKGYLDLPEDFSFEIGRYSTFFSDEGEQSIPVNLPPTPRNLSLLGQPLRLAGIGHVTFSTEAILMAGVLVKKGTLVISEISSDGISVSLSFGNSKIYTDFSGVNIKELFSGHVRSDVKGVEELIDYLNKVNARTVVDDDITVMPVLTELNDGKYVVLNEPDTYIMSVPHRLASDKRLITAGNETEEVPLGYGITPFLFLRKFIELLFEKMGLAILQNAFDYEYFDGMTLLNNTADTICAGTLDYSDLVPSCTVGEFLEFLENKFNIFAFVDNEKNNVSLVCMDAAIEGIPDTDLTLKEDKISGRSVYLAKPQHISYGSDRSLEGAAPPEDTLKAFAAKYPSMAFLNEERFEASEFTSALRLSTGDYYTTKFDPTRKEVRLGSSYFLRDRESTESAKVIECRDVLPPMIMYVRTVRPDIILAPYIGGRIHRHTRTSSDSGSEAGEQKIILAFDLGLSVTGPSYKPSHRIASTQRFNNLGIAVRDFDLNPETVFSLFFRKTNLSLMNHIATLKTKLDLAIPELMDFCMFSPKLLSGVIVLPKLLNYNVGRRVVECRECELAVLHGDRGLTDEDVAIVQETMKWKLMDNASDIAAGFEETYAIVEYEWTEDYDPGTAILPPPTVIGTQTGFFQRRAIFRCYNQFEVLQKEETVICECWWETVPI